MDARGWGYPPLNVVYFLELKKSYLYELVRFQTGVFFWLSLAVLTSHLAGNTVIPMTTLTFKVDEEEARCLRVAARRAKLTLSEYLRSQIRINATEVKSVEQTKCPHTGVMIFAQAPQYPQLTTRTVREMLSDFP